MSKPGTVFIVDDDAAIRDSLRLLLDAAGLACETFAGAREFLEAVSPERPGCLVLDVQMPEIDGLELQKQLTTRGIRLPIIIVTAHGDVPMAVQALRNGAVDFVQKPFDTKGLLQRIHDALGADARNRGTLADQAQIEVRLSRLTPRERQILDLIAEGMSTKSIAQALGSSLHTVQNQRASILKKTQAESVAELVRIAMMGRSR